VARAAARWNRCRARDWRCRSAWTPLQRTYTTRIGARADWQKAVDGIRLARSLGFRVRVAATITAPAPGQLSDFHRFLDLGIGADDQVIRPIAAEGSQPKGLS
jgi:hypothetical protein